MWLIFNTILASAVTCVAAEVKRYSTQNIVDSRHTRHMVRFLYLIDIIGSRQFIHHNDSNSAIQIQISSNTVGELHGVENCPI